MNLKASLRSVDKLREHRRDLKNSLVSSFMKYAVQHHCDRLMALLCGSKKVFYVIPAKAEIQKKILLSHPEFISGYTTRDAETSSA